MLSGCETRTFADNTDASSPAAGRIPARGKRYQSERWGEMIGRELSRE